MAKNARYVTSALIVILLCFLRLAAFAEDLNCLPSEEGGSQTPVTWYKHLSKIASQRLGERTKVVENLRSLEQLQKYQADRRDKLIQQLGGFPERTPLNAQTVSTIQRQGYRIEKVLFESQPNHHVTGNLYVPDGTGKYPAVIVSSGHSRTGKTADYNQRFGIALAENGIIALCFDPIGQGERSQILTSNGTPQVDATTEEHFLIGTGSILIGKNTATYRIWDAIRCLDYLESRPDVNKDRLGMTGCSGGGTLTSYVMAIDPRVYCAAPACYLTTFEHLIATLGPQDSEQNIFGQLVHGIDQSDYVLLRAPKPTLISATTSDFFGISGTWDNYRQNKRIYTRLGLPERLEIVEADGEHGVQPENLAAIVHWMKRWLLNSNAQEPTPVKSFAEYATLPEEELLVTERGQVLTLEAEKSVYQLNTELLSKISTQKTTDSSHGSQSLRDVVSKTLNAPSISDLKVTSKKAGKVQRDSYHIDKLVIRSTDDFPLPALTFHPEEPAEAAYLYISDGGKTIDSQPGGEIEKLVAKGFVVVSVDLRGQGETADGNPHPRLGDWRTFYLAYLLGESVVSAHTHDIISTAKWIANYQSEKPREVHLIAQGNTSVAALHAVLLEPELFTSISVRNGPASWREMVESADQANPITTTIHGVLKHYDLPELRQAIPADKFR